MQIQADFMARFKENNTAKNRHVCQVGKRKAKKGEESKSDAFKMKRGLGTKKEVNQESVNWT